MFYVVKACGAAAMWTKAFVILGQIHEIVLREEEKTFPNEDQQTSLYQQSDRSQRLSNISKVNEYLISLCAREGSAVKALALVDVIEKFTISLSSLVENKSNQSIDGSTIEMNHQFQSLSSLFADTINFD